MEISQFSLPLTFSNPSQLRAALDSWQTGQILPARIEAGKTPETLLVRIGDTVLQAKGQLPFQAGPALKLDVKLQVLALGNHPTLKVLQPAPPANPVTDAIRAQLPRQTPLGALLATLGALKTTTADNSTGSGGGTPARPTPPLPQPVAQLIRSLVNAIPTETKVGTGPGLKQALSNSGLFLENHLAQGRDTAGKSLAPQNDFKANLLRLLAAVRQAAGQTTAQTGTQQQPTAASSSQSGMGATTAAGAAARAPQPPLSDTTTYSLRPVPDRTATSSPGLPASSLATRQETGVQRGQQPVPDKHAGQPARSLEQQLIASGKLNPQKTTTLPGTPGGATPPAPGRTANPTVPPLPITASDGKTAEGQQGATSTLRGLPGQPLQAQPRVPPPPVAQLPLEQLVSELSEQLEGTLARLRLSQLLLLPAESRQDQAWSFELPIRRENALDVLNVRFEQEQANKDNKQQIVWHVTLAFDLDQLGPVYARISLAGKKVSTTISAEQETAVRQINKYLPRLHDSLEDAGLEINQLSCNQGKLHTEQSASLTQTILDTQV